MEENQIIEESINLAVSVAKKSAAERAKGIGIHDLYDQSVEMAEAISYHSIKGVFPKKLFLHRSPNQTAKEAEYIEKNYKNYTLPVFMDYLSTITRPFGDGNWSIDYKEDESEFKQSDKTFQQYVENEVPIYGSLENFIKFILPATKSRDANAFIAIRPFEIPIIKNDKGENMIDSQELYKPIPIVFESKDVVNYTEEYYLFLSSRTSTVLVSDKPQNVGIVYELYTRNAVFMIEQYGKKSDNHFKSIEFYRHDKNKFPVIQLMGVPHLINGKILWQSPFLFATDRLDLVTVNRNWMQFSINKCVFPHVVLYGSPCEFKDENGSICNDGRLIQFDGKETVCPSCNGQGLKSRLSPLGTLLVNPTPQRTDGYDSSTIDPLKFVSPDVTTLEFIDKIADEDELKARTILKIRNKNSQTKTTGDITATEVMDDEKSMTAFVKPISDQIFNIYEFITNWSGIIRYEDKFKEPAFSYPKTFDFKAPEDYLVDIKNAMANNLPPAFIQILLAQYIRSFYSDNEKMLSIFKIVIEADRLFGLGNDEINMQLAKGTAYKWEAILHTSIISFLRTLMEEDKNFLEKDLKLQIEALQKLAKEKSDEEQPADIYTDPTLAA